MMISNDLQQITEQARPIDKNDEMLNRIGLVTRALHENLKGLGFDKIIEQVSKDIPDACERLNYVSRMTEQSAERVLNATDAAIPLQDSISSQTESLKQYWQAISQKPSLKSEYNEAVEKTLVFLSMSEKYSKESKALLMEMMMAQDFQDLTGQVIKKITLIMQELENQLVQVLVDFSPAINSTQESNSKNDSNYSNVSSVNEPQVSTNISDSFDNQQQVDNLLDSLGF